MSSSILENLQSRTIRYIGTRCYNSNYQLIACPLSLPKLIVIAVVLGLFVLFVIIFLILTRCGGCTCRFRRQVHTVSYSGPGAFLPMGEHEYTPTPSAYYVRPAGLSSTPPTSSYLAPPHPYASPFSSRDTLVEPQKAHAATHQHYRPYDV